MSQTKSTCSPSNIIPRPNLIRRSSREVSQEMIMSSDNNKTSWNVSDETLRPIPPYYPPLNPHCTAFIVDTRPSVVAMRIVDCLKKLSIATEYDNEQCKANCMTVDRTHFVVQLYRGERAVIVECSRMSGSVISFHRMRRIILDSAMGNSAEDTRKPIFTSPMEFPRLIMEKPSQDNDNTQTCERAAKRLATSSCSTKTTMESMALLAIENAMTLLRKDRLCAQKLGMESLVALTDEYTSGVELASFVSLVVLGSTDMPSSYSTSVDQTTLSQLHHWIVTIIQERKLPTETEEEGCHSDDDSSTSVPPVNEVVRKINTTKDDHYGSMRALALRVFTNALVLMRRKNSSLLCSILSNEESSSAKKLVNKPFLISLVEDLSGADRSPTSVIGTRLASSHEAALAALCLGELVRHSAVRDLLIEIQEELDTTKICSTLKKARCGNHAVLANAADVTYQNFENFIY